MALKFFNTRSRSIEEFAALDEAGKKVGLYCCGPTVHDLAHIGNFRTFVFADLVRRWLEHKGYAVRHVMNITDVEDKIIKRVHESGAGLPQYTAKYETAFFEDFQTLNCRRPHETPRATGHIADIIDLIDKLLARGIAYRAGDGSIYFSIQKYQAAGHRYGQLLNLNFEHMRPGERVSNDEYAKDAVADFALWKARVADDGNVFWPSPWGEGRPGWHIECSAMSAKLLGPTFDLHMGGEDLIFPHHEDEIAQSEGAGLQSPGKPFVKYWLHGAHLLVEGRKMSKSLGNYFTVRDLLGKGFTGREIRYLLLNAHYRESFNFTVEGLRAGRAALQRLDECLAKLRETAGPAHAPESAKKSPPPEVCEALDDDFNMSRAWGVVFERVSEANRLLAAPGKMDAAKAADTLAALTAVLDLLGLAAAADSEAPAEMAALLEERQTARKAKDFKRSDAIRDELKAKGWLIEDTPKGPRLKPNR
jgi:cysteinyl-tRNA synthetase